jgi:hypothetical protein
VDRLGAVETIEAGGGEDKGVALAGGEFLESGVDVAADFDEGDIRAKGEDLGTTTWAGGTDAASGGKGVEGPVGIADPNVAGVGTFGNCGESELGGKFGVEVLERVDGKIDASFFEGFFDFLNEDALAVEVGGRDETRLLHAVAGGADDFKLDVVAGIAEGVEDVIGLPEGELGAAAANADGIARVIVFAAHMS